MKKYIIIAILAVVGLTICSASGSQESYDAKKIVTFKFSVTDESSTISDEIKDKNADTIANLIVENLISLNRNAYSFLVRDEDIFKQLFNEEDTQTEEFNLEQTSIFGRQTAADYVLTGSIVNIQNLYLVKAQLIDVFSGEIIASSTVSSVTFADIVTSDIAKDIAKEINDQVKNLDKLVEKGEKIQAIASVPFTGTAIDNTHTGDAVASLIINDFVNGGFAVLGRGVTVEEVLNNRNNNESVNESKVSFDPNADTSYLLTGNIDILLHKYTVNFKILDVNTGEIVANITLPEVKDLRTEILENEKERKKIFNTLNKTLNDKENEKNVTKKVSAFGFAVVDPYSDASTSTLNSYETLITDLLTQHLEEEGESDYVFLARDEQAVNEMSKEINFQTSGISTAQAAEFGKQSTADYVLNGSVVIFEDLYLVKAQLVDVFTGEISATATRPIYTLESLRDENLAISISKELHKQIENKNSMIEKEKSYNTIATLPFSGNIIELESQGDAIASLFINDFVEAGYVVLGRGITVDNITAEGIYQSSGFTESNTLQDESRSATSYILTGSIDYTDKEYICNVKILEVNSGEIIANLTLTRLNNLRNQVIVNDSVRNEIFTLLDTNLNNNEADRQKLEKLLKDSASAATYVASNDSQSYSAQSNNQYSILSKNELIQKAESIDSLRSGTAFTYIVGGITTIAGGLLYPLPASTPDDAWYNIDTYKNKTASIVALSTGTGIILITAIADIAFLNQINTIEEELDSRFNAKLNLSIEPNQTVNSLTFDIGAKVSFML